MANSTEKKWDTLTPLQPFFRSYSESFVNHFLASYKEHYQIDAGRLGRAAATHLYIRHFIPDLPKSKYPPMQDKVEPLYKDMLKASHIISLAVIQMMKDLMVFQNESSAEELACFQTYLAENIPSSGLPEKKKLEKVVEKVAAKTGGAAARSPVIDMLKKIQEESIPLKCFNIYKDVPVSFDAEVVQILSRKKMASIRMNEMQATATKLEGKTYLKSKIFPGTVQATLVSINMDKNTALVSNFHLANLREENRASERVQPNPPIVLNVHKGKVEVAGKVLDISLAGIGLTGPKNAFKVGDDVTLQIALPPKKNKMKIPGEVVAARQEEKSCTAGIRMKLTDDIEKRVKEYIKARQGEVIQELRRTMDA